MHHTLLANCYDTILDKKVQLVRVEGSQFYFLKQNLCLLRVLQEKANFFCSKELPCTMWLPRKFIQSKVSNSHNLKQPADLLQDRFDSRVVKSATRFAAMLQTKLHLFFFFFTVALAVKKEGLLNF